MPKLAPSFEMRCELVEQSTRHEPTGATVGPNVIIGGAPLLGKLTGIGHYTRQLASALDEYELLSDLRLMGDFSFLDVGLLNQLKVDSYFLDEINRSEMEWKVLVHSIRESARSFGSRSYVATKTYSSITNWVTEKRLRKYAQSHLFHSPNFVLPNYDGPKVVTIHDLSVIKHPEFHRKQMVEICERGIMKGISEGAHILTDSYLVQEELKKEFGVSDDRISTVHLAPDAGCRPRGELECRSQLERLGIAYRHFYLCVGTIEPRKNLLRLFDAFRIGRQEGIFDWPLVVVGARGWKSDDEHRALQKLCDDGLAIFPEYVGDSLLRVLYSAAGCLVFPSVYEGFGLPVIEAMSSGCPVIASHGTAVSEFADDQVSFFDPLDIDMLKCNLQARYETPLPKKSISKGRYRSWYDVAVETRATYSKAWS